MSCNTQFLFDATAIKIRLSQRWIAPHKTNRKSCDYPSRPPKNRVSRAEPTYVHMYIRGTLHYVDGSGASHRMALRLPLFGQVARIAFTVCLRNRTHAYLQSYVCTIQVHNVTIIILSLQAMVCSFTESCNRYCLLSFSFSQPRTYVCMYVRTYA